MPPFPLLRLPGVVLGEVFKSLGINEKIYLSLCSKKISTQIISAQCYSQKVVVCLEMKRGGITIKSKDDSDYFEIAILHDSKIDDSTIQSYSIGRCTLPMISKVIETVWSDLAEGYMYVTGYLLKIFRCKISTGQYCTSHELFEPILTELFNQQLEFEMITISLQEAVGHNWMGLIFRNLGLVEHLEIPFTLCPGFIPVFNSWPRKINIESSYWFKLESLLACTSSIITLSRSHLGNKDLDEVLQNWKAGGFPNLERLEIHSDNIKHNETMILGMNLEELDGKVVQTDDGSKKATITCGYGRIEMSVTPVE